MSVRLLTISTATCTIAQRLRFVSRVSGESPFDHLVLPRTASLRHSGLPLLLVREKIFLNDELDGKIKLRVCQITSNTLH